MACILRSNDLQDVLDVIEAVLADPNTNINTYDDLVAYFAANLPEVTEAEIAQAVAPLNDQVNQSITKVLDDRKKRLKRLQTAANRLNDMFEKGLPDPTKRLPPDEMINEINKLTKDIADLAGVDMKIPEQAYGEIISRMENLKIFNDAAFQFNGTEASVQRLKDIVESARVIRRAAKIDQIDAKIAEIDEQIAGLKAGNVDFSAVEDLDVPIKVPGLEKEIAEKELELGLKRAELEARMAQVRRKAKAEKGFLGFTGKAMTRVISAGYAVKENLWEPFRSLKFMADLSAYGVQAAPVIYSMMTDVNVKELYKGNFAEAFQSQRDLARIFKESTAKVVLDGWRNRGRGWRTAKSTYAQVLLNNIRNDPAFPLAKKAGLQISDSGSLTMSEEMFTSDLVNKIPGMGAIKDLSEDTMVSTLNMLRMLKFNQFLKANPTANLRELEKVAETINLMTGTFNPKTGVEKGYVMFGGVFFSAPKLFVSRLKLLNPKRVAGVLTKFDIPASVEQRKVVFQTEADRFVFNQMMKSVAGYVGITALLAMIPGVDFEEDPRKKDFLRFTAGDLRVDATGGLGAIARMVLKSLYFIRYQNTDTMPAGSDIRPPAFNENAISVLTKASVEYKLHPTFHALHSTATGRDFFGNSYHLISEKGAAPHIEAAARTFMPILFEGILDNAVDLANGDVSFGKATAELALNVIGASTYRTGNPLTDPKIDTYFKEIDYKPGMRYPKELSDKVTSRTQELLKLEYAGRRNDAIEEIIKNAGYDASALDQAGFKALWEPIKQQLEREFVEEYKADLDALQNDPEKEKKKKKKTTNPLAPKK